MINTYQTSFQRKYLGWSKKSLTISITYMSTSHSILHHKKVKINTKIYANNIQDSHQELYQDIFQDNNHHNLHNIFNDFKDIYQYIGSHTKIKYELYPSETCSITREPRSMSHTFLKIIRWRNSRKTEINSRSCRHISLITSFPTSQEFCNSDSVWESYVNFSEDAQIFALFSKSYEITKRIDDE